MDYFSLNSVLPKDLITDLDFQYRSFHVDFSGFQSDGNGYFLSVAEIDFTRFQEGVESMFSAEIFKSHMDLDSLVERIGKG